MSVLDPEPEDIVPEPEPEEPVVVPPAPAKVVDRAFRDVCAHCMRPCFQDDRPESEGGYLHWDSRIDDPSNPAFHLAELYNPEPTRWGHLNDGKKSQFEVKQGPSKVPAGWSGGGVK